MVVQVLEWVKLVALDLESECRCIHLLILVHGVKEVKKKDQNLSWVERTRPQRARSTTRKKQSIQGNTNSRRHTVARASLRPVFQKTGPMSNFDLLEWCQYLKIPIKNVLSRDQNVPHNHKLGLFIYNLEPSYMNGSHWVATYVKDRVINYFDSFGMPPFEEMVNHAKRKKT